MRNIALTLLFFLTLIYLSSCCLGKKKCDGVDSVIEIRYYGFSDSEAAKLNVEEYDGSSNFSHNLSVSRVDAQSYNGFHSYYYPLTPGHQYILRLNNSTRNDSINAITTAQSVCNNCPFNKDYYIYVDGYFLNGQKYPGTTVNIYK